MTITENAFASTSTSTTTAALLKQAQDLQKQLLAQAENDVKDAKAAVETAVKAVTDSRDALRKANATLKSVKAAGPRQARKPKVEKPAKTEK